MDKKLKISLDLDDKAFVQAVKNMQQQLNQINSGPALIQQQRKISQYMVSQGMAPLTGVGPREQEQAQRKANQESDKAFQTSIVRLNTIKRLQADINKELATGLATKQRIATLEGRAELLTRKEKEFTGRATAGMANAPGAATGGMFGSMSMLGKASAAVIGGVVYQKVLGVLGDIAKAPIDISQLQGSAVGGLTGRTLSQMQSGEFSFEGMFPQQRQRAMQNAQSKAQANKVLSLLDPFAWKDVLTGKRGAEISAQTTSDFNTGLEGLISQDTFKQDAVNRLKKNAMRDIGVQRTLGLNDKDLFKFLLSSTNAGFSDQMGVDAMQQIIGAGGSSQMGKNSVMALKAQRGLDLTNAPQLLGKLSGTLGGAESSKNALIDIVATGQQIGLDRSKFAEENRKFSQNVVDLAAKSGLTSVDAIDKLSQMMGSFVTGTTTQRGIEAGKTAFQAVSGIGASTSGFTGGLNVSSLMDMPGISNVKDVALFQGLASLQLDEISPTNDMIVSAANMMGTSPEKLAADLKMQKIGVGKTSLQRSSAFGAGVGEIKSAAYEAFKKGGTFNPSQFGFKKGGAAETGLGGLEKMFGIVSKTTGQPEMRQGVLGLETEMAMQQLQDRLSGSQKPEDKAVLKRIEEYRKNTLSETNKDYEKGPGQTGRELDKLLGVQADQAAVSIRTLAGAIKYLADTSAESQARITGHEKQMRTAAAVSANTTNASLFGIGTEAYEAAQMIQQNINAGKDPMSGLTWLQKMAYNRYASKTQDQTTSPGASGKQ